MFCFCVLFFLQHVKAMNVLLETHLIFRRRRRRSPEPPARPNAHVTNESAREASSQRARPSLSASCSEGCL